ncbi:hypothetical protein OROMI_011761 [Orobanche minor]
MSLRLESITFRNPSPSLNRAAAPMALRHAPPASLGFEAFCRAKIDRKVSISAIPTVLGVVTLRQRSVLKRSVSSFAASHEESKARDIDIDEKEDLKMGAQESEEAWQETLASFKQQALKMQSMSKEAYEMYSEKAMIILIETSENLKIQAEKARQDLTVVAKEIAEESKEYLATAAENSPEPVKDIVETFTSSTDEFKDVSKVRDFYVGIPYGALLSVGGFASFMLTGSITAIRFGIILGGTLLALSISSLRSWKRGDFFPLVLKGQTAIATILFLRQVCLLSTSPSIAIFISTLIRMAEYLHSMSIGISELEGRRGSNLEISPENETSC